MKIVKYISDLGFYDGLSKGLMYEVIEEDLESYAVPNDMGGKSRILKEKFEVCNIVFRK